MVGLYKCTQRGMSTNQQDTRAEISSRKSLMWNPNMLHFSDYSVHPTSSMKTLLIFREYFTSYFNIASNTNTCLESIGRSSSTLLK